MAANGTIKSHQLSMQCSALHFTLVDNGKGKLQKHKLCNNFKLLPNIPNSEFKQDSPKLAATYKNLVIRVVRVVRDTKWESKQKMVMKTNTYFVI